MDFNLTSYLKFVTQECDLEAFLNAAQLAGTKFTAGTVSHFFFCNSSFGLHCRMSQHQNHSIDIHSAASGKPWGFDNALSDIIHNTKSILLYSYDWNIDPQM